MVKCRELENDCKRNGPATSCHDYIQYRMPERSLEPLFRAVLNQRPDFRITVSDIITDRNNLRKLLSYIQGKENEPFTTTESW